jgi:hypothetical protein
MLSSKLDPVLLIYIQKSNLEFSLVIRNIVKSGKVSTGTLSLGHRQGKIKKIPENKYISIKGGGTQKTINFDGFGVLPCLSFILSASTTIHRFSLLQPVQLL